MTFSKNEVESAFDKAVSLLGDLFAGKQAVREVSPQMLGCERYRLTFSGGLFSEVNDAMHDLGVAIHRMRSPVETSSDCTECVAGNCCWQCGRVEVSARLGRSKEDPFTVPQPEKTSECQHDLLKPDTTIEVIDPWKAKCKVCIEFFDLPGRPEKTTVPVTTQEGLALKASGVCGWPHCDCNNRTTCSLPVKASGEPT